MFWALLAKFLLRQPAWVQAVMLGLCTGMSSRPQPTPTNATLHSTPQP